MKTTSNKSGFIKILRLIHIGLVSGIVIFALFTIMTHKSRLFFSVETDKNFLYIALIVAFLGNWASKTIYNNTLRKLSINSNFNDKILKYTNAYIYKLAFLEFAAMLCTFLAYKFYNSFYLILVCILIIIMLSKYPSKNKIVNDVPFTSEEKSML
jgi:hypothetical protein